MKVNIDPKKALSVASMVLGVAGVLLTNKVDANNRSAMKDELKKELLDELSKNK